MRGGAAGPGRWRWGASRAKRGRAPLSAGRLGPANTGYNPAGLVSPSVAPGRSEHIDEVPSESSYFPKGIQSTGLIC